MQNIEQYDFKEGNAHALEVIDLAQFYQSNYKQLINYHKVPYYQIIWFKKGTSMHWVDFQDLEIEPNSIVVLNKNTVQKFYEKGYPRGKCLLFTEDFFCKTNTDVNSLQSSILYNNLLSIPKFKIEQQSLNLQKILNQIILELEHPKDNYQTDILRNHIRNFLLHLERERNHQDFIDVKKDENLNLAFRFKRLLEENFKVYKNVSFYCETMHISPKKLNSVTLQIFKVSPKSIIIDRVLLEAKRLLVSSSKNTKEIAFILGFEESTNFVKFFRKHIKRTPLEFRDVFN